MTDMSTLGKTATDLLFRAFAGKLKTLVISSTAQGAYDPATGGTAADSSDATTSSTTKAALVDYQRRDIDGEVIRVGDVRAFVRATELEDCQSGDAAVCEGVTYEVRNAKQDMFESYWDLQLRRLYDA